MAIYTFSTRAKRPNDTEAVERAKDYCEQRGINFSTFVVQLIANWDKENGERSAEVQSSKPTA